MKPRLQRRAAPRILRILLAATCLLAAHGAALGEESVRFDSSLQAWVYGSTQAPAREGALHTPEEVARVPGHQLIGDVRLNMRLSSDPWEGVLEPRLLSDSEFGGAARRHSSEASVRQAFGRLTLAHAATLTAGRKVMAWGPANFRSPSSPFYFDLGKLNLLREVAGIDLLRAEKVAGSGTYAIGYVFDAPAQTGRYTARTGFVKIDYQGATSVVSVNAAKASAGKPFFGAYAQLSASDALLLYAEYGHGERAGPPALQETPPFLRAETSGRSAASAMLGASYTLLDGQIVSLEALHDGHGYSGAQQGAYAALLAQSASLAATARDPALRGASFGTLGLAAANIPALLGRNYLSLLWQSNPQESAQYWRLGCVANLHGPGMQLSGYYEKSVSPHFSVFVNAVRNAGPSNSEFRLVVGHVLTLGIKAFIF
ncbi:MAG: hypothetical protein ACYC0T_10780 [Ramlibacter sp.]